MSNVNPYGTPGTAYVPVDTPPVFRKVFSNPIELVQRSFQMVKSKYWLFLGVTLVGSILASFIITLGPMMVGIYYCYIQHEAGRNFEFGDVFKGFDKFVEALLASLAILGLAMVLFLPLMIIMIVMTVQADGHLTLAANLFFNLAFMAVGVVIQLPFLFIFPLLAEYRIKPMEAVALSAKAAFANIGSVIVNLICIGIASMIASTVCCYIGGIFFLPISMGWMFLLYRDIFAKSPSLATA